MKDKALFIIDMQEYFTNKINLKDYSVFIKNYVSFLKSVKHLNLPTYVFEFKGHGKTLNFLIKNLNNYQIISKNSNSAFKQTNLEDILKKQMIKEIILTGVNASVCVKWTASSAKYRGYKFITSPDLIEDNKGDKCLNWFSSNGILLKDYKKVIDYLNYFK